MYTLLNYQSVMFSVDIFYLVKDIDKLLTQD